jgi:hypothetical protein
VLDQGDTKMVGIIAGPSDHDVVHEFFELFKTPWEWYREDRQYEVVLCAGDSPFNGTAKLVLLYAGKKISFDDERRILTKCAGRQTCVLSHKGKRIPIYGDILTFPKEESRLLTDEDSRESAVYLEQSGQGAVVRIGYDLFSEIRRLLTQGQPPANADMPALELHIALLRELIIGHGLRLIEVPPIPAGYSFIACLTHDVDHPSIRQHQWDHTMFGFLYRAVFGSLRHLIVGRITLRDLLKNWAAVLKLPFVYAGFASDFWREFDDRYLELEKGLHSTFFVIPFKNSPGQNSQGPAPAFRSARYSAADLSDTILKLTSAGCEVGLHGIDAWCDSAQGHAELEEIRRLTGESKIGVRMHWLYYDQQSPAALEQADAAYDSTIGYNETVGYRAGTTQVYKPLEVTRLLELPLHVMDTAMFYPAHLGFSPRQAKTVLGRMADNVARFGGCLTVNWHDRSLAPERLWDTSYRDLVQDLKNRGAWFATAGDAVSWFQKRRSVVFETDGTGSEGVRAKVTLSHNDGLPGLRLRIYKGREQRDVSTLGTEDCLELAFDEMVDTRVSCGVSI